MYAQENIIEKLFNFWDISKEISVETYLNQRNKIEQSIDDLRNELAQIKYSKNYHEITRDLKNDINSSIGFHYYERLKN